MDRDAALGRLSGAYARALRLADGGASPAEIAADLGIDVEAVGPLLVIGERKLARLMASDAPPADGP